MACSPLYDGSRRSVGIACGRGGKGKTKPCTFCRAPSSLLCDGKGCDVPVCGACASSVRPLDKDFCPRCIVKTVEGCAAAAIISQVKCVGPETERSADGAPVCVAHSLCFTLYLRAGGYESWKRLDVTQAVKRDLFRHWVAQQWADLELRLRELTRRVS